MPKKKKENQKPRTDKNVRNEILGSPKIVRLMQLWNVPAKKEIAREGEFEVK